MNASQLQPKDRLRWTGEDLQVLAVKEGAGRVRVDVVTAERDPRNRELLRLSFRPDTEVTIDV